MEENESQNKAGYTTNTSCGRVGRGGNKRFRLVFTDQPTDQPTDGRTDKASYRVACPQLKKKKRKYRERRKKERRVKRKKKGDPIFGLFHCQKDKFDL